MQGLSVFEKGTGYLEACLSRYTGSNAYGMLYILALVYILVFGNEKEKQIFLPAGVFLVLTVYNPAAPVILNRFFDVNSEYYRLFWITPVVILVPYLSVKLVALSDHRPVTLALLSAILIFSGSFIYASGIPFAENIYKMPAEMLEVSRLIHADAEVEYPKVFLEYEYNMQMRQYDPKLLLTVDREAYMNAVMYGLTEEQLNDETHPEYRLIAALVRNEEIYIDDFIDALEETRTEYIVIDKTSPMVSYLKDAGLSEVGSTENRYIMKYTLKEPYEFELVDYSVVY